MGYEIWKSINTIEGWVGALWNLRCKRGKEKVQISLAVHVVQILKDAQLVPSGALGWGRDVVESLDTQWNRSNIAESTER